VRPGGPGPGEDHGCGPAWPAADRRLDPNETRTPGARSCQNVQNVLTCQNESSADSWPLRSTNAELSFQKHVARPKRRPDRPSMNLRRSENRPRRPSSTRRSRDSGRRSRDPGRRSRGSGRRSRDPMRRSRDPMRRSRDPMRRSRDPMRRSRGSGRRSRDPMRRSRDPMRRSRGPGRRNRDPERPGWGSSPRSRSSMLRRAQAARSAAETRGRGSVGELAEIRGSSATRNLRDSPRGRAIRPENPRHGTRRSKRRRPPRGPRDTRIARTAPARPERALAAASTAMATAPAGTDPSRGGPIGNGRLAGRGPGRAATRHPPARFGHRSAAVSTPVASLGGLKTSRMTVVSRASAP